jgi:hypothetical protein
MVLANLTKGDKHGEVVSVTPSHDRLPEYRRHSLSTVRPACRQESPATDAVQNDRDECDKIGTRGGING